MSLLLSPLMSRSPVQMMGRTKKRHTGDGSTRSHPRRINSSLAIVLLTIHCFAFLTSRGVHAQNPSFRTAPQNTEVILGKSKTLNCEVNNFDKNKHSLNWIQLPGKILFTNNNRQWAPVRMNIVGSLDNGEFNLNISDAQSEDDGSYECQIVTFDVRKANFTVLIPPSIKFEPAESLKIMEGGTNSLKCVVEAKPQVTSVKWSKDGSLIQGETQFELRITNAKKSDQGAYTCEAENSAGKTSKSHQIQILYAPKVSITAATNGELRVNQSDNLNVLCDIDANPTASVKWVRDGTSQEWPGNRLIINDIRKGQSGTYTCHAENTLQPTGQSETIGRGSASMKLIVQYVSGAVSVTKDASSNLIVGGQVTLTCALTDAGSPGEPTAELVWTKQDDSSFSRVGSKLVINPLKLSDDGIYICTPTNIVGKGQAGSYQLVVHEATSFLPPLLSTELNVSKSQKGFELTCRVRGRPEPVIQWYKDNTIIPLSVLKFYKISKTQQSIDTHSFNVTSVLRFEGSGREPVDAIRIEDKGTYKCVAKSVDNIDPSQSTKIKVLYAPVVNAQQRVAVDMNESALIICRSHAFPQPRFEWYNGSVRLTEGDRIKIKTMVVDGVEFPHQSLLNISDMQPGDMGTYSCKAINNIGSNQVNIELTVKTWPYQPENLTLLSFTWESAFLRWKAGFDGGYSQHFVIDIASSTHKLGLVHVQPPDATEYNVTGLRPSTQYTFRVYGKNAKGSGKYSNSVDLQTSALDIPKPWDVKYNKDTRQLTFKAPDGLYCVRVEVSENNINFTVYTKCAPPTGGSMKLDGKKRINHVNVSVCLERRHDVCSPAVSATVETTEVVPMTTIIIVASLCGTIVVVLLVILVVLCCRRQKNKQKYEENSNKSRMKVPEIANNGRGYANAALDQPDAVDLDDPRRGGVFATNTSHQINEDPHYDYARQGYPPNGHIPNHRHGDKWMNGHMPTDPPPSYDPYDGPMTDHYSSRGRPMDVQELNMKNYYNGHHNVYSQSQVPKHINRIPENGMVDMNSSGDSVPYSDSNKSGGSIQKLQQDSSSHHSNESGYSTPDPTKPKKVIYEVMV